MVKLPEEIGKSQTASSSKLVQTLQAYEKFLVDVHRVAFMTYNQTPAEVEAGEYDIVYLYESMDAIRLAVSEFVETWNNI